MKLVLPFLVPLCLFTACSTIVCGTHQKIKVRSNPAGASVKVDGISHGVTPAEFELSVRKEHRLCVELPGYKPYEASIDRHFNGWVFGNLVFGGIIGIIIDCADGAIYCLLPDEYDAQLEPLKGAGKPSRRTTAVSVGKDTLIVATTLQSKPGWKKIGQLERL